MFRRIFSATCAGLALLGCENEQVSSQREVKLESASAQIFLPIDLDDLYLASTPSLDVFLSKGFRPRSSMEFWPIEWPIDWGADPFKDDNWQFQLHAWRMNDGLLLDYFNNENREALSIALKVVLDWQTWHSRNEATEFSWNDMATGLRAMHLATLLDLDSRIGLMADEEKARIIKLSEEHITRLREREFIGMDNHGMFQLYGLSILCEVLAEDKACDGVLPYIVTMMNEVMETQFTQAGVHKENSPSYHFFVANLMCKLFRAHPDQKRLNALLDRAEKVKFHLIFPDGKIAPVGDSEGVGELFEQGKPSVCLDKGECYLIGDFSKSGYVSIRSAGENVRSMLFVPGMSHVYAHKHSDELSFVLWEFGRYIFVDSGKYTYDDNAWRGYFVSAAAHNTISLETTPFRFTSIVRQGSNFSEFRRVRDYFRIKGTVRRRDLFRQKREIRYSPGKWILVSDQLRSDEPRRYVSSLLLAPDLSPKIISNGFDVDMAGRGHVKARLVAGEDCELEVVRGQEEPVILGWVSKRYREKQPASVVRAICPGKNRKIVWRIEFLGGASP
jgi:heparinase II/III-like protein